MGTHVLYYVQGELGEAQELPNALKIQGGKEGQPIKFGDFIDSFLQVDNPDIFHFRFQMPDPKCGYVWKDLVNRDEPLPVYNGVSFAKVLRVDPNATTKRKLRLRLKGNILHSSSASADFSPVRPHIERSSSSSSSRTQNHQQQQTKAGTQVQNSLFDDDVIDSSPRPDPDHDTRRSAAPTRAPEKSVLQHPEPEPEEPVQPAFVEKVFNRDELVAAREAAVQDKVQEALEFKLELDANARKEADELDAAKEAFDAKLTTWSTVNKEKKNVRSLLTSMHTVLWEGAKWKPIGLGDVIDSKKVKLAFRKAMLVVHPDRCSGLSAEVRFIAKRVFEAVNDAYQDFLVKEGVD